MQPTLVVEPCGIDDQRIGLPPADRVAAPRWLGIHGKRAAIDVDLPMRVVHLIEHHDDARSLDDLEWRVAEDVGRIGASSGLKSARILRKYRENVLGSSPGTTKSLRDEPNRRSFTADDSNSVCQTPDRSGFPSGARGVFADRLGLPSFPRGVRGLGWFNH